MPDPINPYLPSGLDRLSALLMSLGSGMSNAAMSGRSGWDGLPMAGALYAGAMNNANQQALQADRWEKQYGEQAAWRKAQEENLRSQVDQRSREASMDEALIRNLIPGMGVRGAAPTATPGMTVPPAKPTIGPGPSALNIGNVRPVGSSTGFQQPPSFDDGVALTVRNVRAYPAAFNNGQPMNLMQIGQRWAPRGDGGNDPGAWAFNVSHFGGLDPNQPLDLNDPVTAAKFARGVHGAEKGAGAVRPIADYGAGVQLAQAPSGTSPTPTMPSYGAPTPPRIDPLQYAPFLLSKRLSGFGKGMIDLGNADIGHDLDERKFQQSIDQDTEKRQQFDRTQGATERNQAVGPDGRPNQPLIDAQSAEAAAKAKAEADARLNSQAATALVKQAVNQFVEKDMPKAQALQETIPQLYNMRRLIDAGALTGPGLSSRNFLLQLAHTVGFDVAPEQASLTPAYMAALAQQITSNAKSLGINPTDRDAQIIKEAQGASPDTSKDAMLRLLDVNENIQRQAHDRYIASAKRLMTLRGVKEAYPEDYLLLPTPPTYQEWLKNNSLPGGAGTPANALDAEMKRRGLPMPSRAAPSTGNPLQDELRRRGLQ